MRRILTVNEAIKVSKEMRDKGRQIVLAGGCFDILHAGHIRFLKKAKARGDVLFILLESDKSCSRKDKGRPINFQEDRAEVLSSLYSVDYVISLKDTLKDGDYDDMIEELKPDVLATTHRDPNIVHKKRQAERTGAKLIFVIKRISKYSSTKILKS